MVISIEEKILRRILPSLITNLMAKDLIDLEKHDINYIRTLIIDYPELINNLNIQVTTFDTLRESIEAEISAGRIQPAIVLTGICIEHLFNFFYRDILAEVHNLSQENISRAILCLNIEDKAGWFLQLTSQYSLPEDLYKRIITINSIRYNIEHYEAIPQPMTDLENSTGSNNLIEKMISTLQIDNLDLITHQLESELSKALEHLIPSYRSSLEYIRKYF